MAVQARVGDDDPVSITTKQYWAGRAKNLLVTVRTTIRREEIVTTERPSEYWGLSPGTDYSCGVEEHIHTETTVHRRAYGMVTATHGQFGTIGTVGSLVLGPGDGYASGYGAVLGGGVVTRSANDALAATFQTSEDRVTTFGAPVDDATLDGVYGGGGNAYPSIGLNSTFGGGGGGAYGSMALNNTARLPMQGYGSVMGVGGNPYPSVNYGGPQAAFGSVSYLGGGGGGVSGGGGFGGGFGTSINYSNYGAPSVMPSFGYGGGLSYAGQSFGGPAYGAGQSFVGPSFGGGPSASYSYSQAASQPQAAAGPQTIRKPARQVSNRPREVKVPSAGANWRETAPSAYGNYVVPSGQVNAVRAPRLAQGTGGVVNPAAGKFQRVRTVRYDEDEAREWEPPLAAQDAESLLDEADSSAFTGFELVDHSTASMIQRTFYPAGRLVPRRAVKPVVEEETWPSAPADDDDGGDGDEVEVVLPTIRDLVPAYPVDLPEPGRPKVPEPVSLPRPFVPSTPIQQPQAVAYKDPRPASDPAVTEPAAAPEVVDEGDYMLSDTSSEFEFPEMPPTGATAHPYKRCIVVDNGSGDIRAGYAGETAPSQWMPNIVGRAKYQNVMETFDMEDAFIGNHAQAKRGVLAITHPVEHGVVKNWHDMEMVWEYLFEYEMDANLSEHPVLISEPPMNPRKNRERIAEIMFEKFDVPALYIANNSVLAMHAAGLNTGLVVDSGAGVTYATPVLHGHALSHATERLNVGGSDVTDLLQRYLNQNGAKLTTSSGRDIVRQIKEMLCYVAPDYVQELEKGDHETSKRYLLPDGSSLDLAHERFQAPEITFDASRAGLDYPTLAQLCVKAVRQAPDSEAPHFWRQVLVTGGNSMTPGFETRLRRDLSDAVPDHRVKIVAPPNRNTLAWRGGSMISAQPFFGNMWISADLYDDVGVNCVHYHSW